MPMPRIRPAHAAAAFMVLVLFVSPACESSFSDEGHISLDQLEGRSSPAPSSSADAPAAASQTPSASGGSAPSGNDNGSAGSPPSNDTGATAPSGSYNTSSDIGGIQWLNLNVSSWPVTTTLHAGISGGRINMEYDKANVWPVVGEVVANCWAIVKINGKWYAGTFEYLRPGQTSKSTGVLDGSRGPHFQKEPLKSWRPRSGERFGLMVSGLCRDNRRNVSERSNIAIVTWP